MSQHRRHYFDLNPRRGPLTDRLDSQMSPRLVPDWMLVLIVLALLAAHAVAVILDDSHQHLVKSRTPGAQQAQPTQTVEEARIQGFRAGAQQGCTTLLSSPLPTP